MKREGYLFIDHTASPGLSPDLARSVGLDPKLVAEGKVLEAATMTCAHCKGVVVKNPFRISERYECSKCGNHYICDNCARDMRMPFYDHTPYEKRVDLALAGKEVDLLGSPQKLILPT